VGEGKLACVELYLAALRELGRVRLVVNVRLFGVLFRLKYENMKKPWTE
jgi:hypothetical protein